MPAWKNSTRRDRLPADWPRRRRRIQRRDGGLCQVVEDGVKCLRPASDVDHVLAGDDHSDENLQCICDWHHKSKSSSEGGAALARKRKAVRQSFRRTEAHPGLQ